MSHLPLHSHFLCLHVPAPHLALLEALASLALCVCVLFAYVLNQLPTSAHNAMSSASVTQLRSLGPAHNPVLGQIIQPPPFDIPRPVNWTYPERIITMMFCGVTEEQQVQVWRLSQRPGCRAGAVQQEQE